MIPEPSFIRVSAFLPGSRSAMDAQPGRGSTIRVARAVTPQRRQRARISSGSRSPSGISNPSGILVCSGRAARKRASPGGGPSRRNSRSTAIGRSTRPQWDRQMPRASPFSRALAHFFARRRILVPIGPAMPPRRGRMTKTGLRACRMTLFATLPRRSRRSPP